MDLGTHPEALANYPHGPFGPPVFFPQQQLTPIYHNRGIWPFVTAYSVIAARQADNGAVLNAGLDSLVRGAALNLSHMENFELATGANWLEDGDYSGPVVNSQRQLWSVAGFLGAVAHGVFGVQGADGTLTASPILPSGDWFADGATLTLHGETFTIAGDSIGEGRITTFETTDWQDVFGARTPSLSVSGSGSSITLEFGSEETDATFSVYRDGVLVEEDATSPWTDEATTTACYSVVARLKHAGQPSAPQCWWGDDFRRIQTVSADAFTATGGIWSTEHGRGHYGNWGAADHTLSLDITPENTGEHYIQAVYGNGSGTLDTGITAAVKWVEVTDEEGTVVGSGPLVMPHRVDWTSWGDSSFVPVRLDAGRVYTVTIRDGWNMSYLAHYTAYVGGRGGGDEPSNDVNIAELKLLFMR
jgi:hypothetical protein